MQKGPDERLFSARFARSPAAPRRSLDLTELTAGVPWPRESVLMPHSRPSSQRKQAPASGGYQTLVVPISQPAAWTADPSLLQELELLSRAGSPGRGDRLV